MGRVMDEFDLIDQVFRPLAIAPGAHGLCDDGAALPPAPAGQEWRITTDTLIAGVHFRPCDTPDALMSLAWRALATNVSDLVAQLAKPQFYTLNLSLSGGMDMDMAAFGQGLGLAQQAMGCSLLGGDTTRTPGPFTLSITAFGLGYIGDNPLRSQAKAGQAIGLLCAPHGPLGAAKAGFEAGIEENSEISSETNFEGSLEARGRAQGDFTAAYARPQSCLASLTKLQGTQISAMADVSDGLLQDLGHICRASGVGARVQLAALPTALPAEPSLPQITWGDDYALVMTADRLPTVPGLIQIGTTTPEPEVKLLNARGEEIQVEAPGYVHQSNL